MHPSLIEAAPNFTLKYFSNVLVPLLKISVALYQIFQFKLFLFSFSIDALTLRFTNKIHHRHQMI